MRLYYRAGTGRPLRVAWELEELADIVVGGVLAVGNFVGVLDAAPDPVGAYFERLRARPAYARAAERTESMLTAG